MMASEFVALSLTPVLIAAFAGMACALPGNFLVLRKQALIGDAISHVMLPGIVVAYLISGRVTTWPMMFGAAGAAIVSVFLIEIIRRLGRIEFGAAMGVVFTAMFAAGVLLLEQSETSEVHLDVEHALFGNLEMLIWLQSDGWGSLLDLNALAQMPPQFFRMLTVFLLICLFTYIFWRPLVLISFDEAYARTIGTQAPLIGLLLVIFAAITAVAAFDAVGSIIVIAMILCPPASARLLTNNVRTQVFLSLGLALSATLAGYILASYAPLWLGFSDTVSAAGMISTLSGVFLAFSAVYGRHRKRIV